MTSVLCNCCTGKDILQENKIKIKIKFRHPLRKRRVCQLVAVDLLFDWTAATTTRLGRCSVDAGTCVHAVVGFQLVLEAELLPAAVTFVGLLSGVDALVALQRALVPEAATAELALVWVVPSWKVDETHINLGLVTSVLHLASIQTAVILFTPRKATYKDSSHFFVPLWESGRLRYEIKHFLIHSLRALPLFPTLCFFFLFFFQFFSFLFFTCHKCLVYILIVE